MRIVHIIDSLGIGGAEKLLAGVVKALNGYEHTVIYLSGKNYYEKELSDAALFYLNYKSRIDTISAVFKLKKILRLIQPDIIHSHLPTATYITRLVGYKKCKHFFTVHNLLSEAIYHNSKITWYLEKWLYRKGQHAIFVSKVIKDDYEHKLGLGGSYSILYNFIEDEFFVSEKSSRTVGDLVRFVSVGTLKDQKNHQYLIESFARLPHDKYQLDIIGNGPQEKFLRAKIIKLKATNVHLKLQSNDISSELRKYDFFLLASSYEGFGIAPIEAMAVGLPLILADIKVLRETTNNHALFFDLKYPNSLIDIINNLPHRISEIDTNIELGVEWVKDMYSLKNYTNKLIKIYDLNYASK